MIQEMPVFSGKFEELHLEGWLPEADRGAYATTFVIETPIAQFARRPRPFDPAMRTVTLRVIVLEPSGKRAYHSQDEDLEEVRQVASFRPNRSRTA